MSVSLREWGFNGELSQMGRFPQVLSSGVTWSDLLRERNTQQVVWRNGNNKSEAERPVEKDGAPTRMAEGKMTIDWMCSMR